MRLLPSKHSGSAVRRMSAALVIVESWRLLRSQRTNSHQRQCFLRLLYLNTTPIAFTGTTSRQGS